ncbi:MAG TPA: hypothetical protein VEH31_38975, partial [Streptosporangiaceae bacterium]|nr:hypothetical protein [Streptosporangiaceae bacterium]
MTGSAAFLTDFKDTIVQQIPKALAIIGLAAFAMLMTGSVLTPVGPDHEHHLARRDLRRAYASGRRRQKQEPPVPLGSYQASPPFAWAKVRTIHSPSPVPSALCSV